MREPLWMPEGSVRSMIALALVGGALGLIYLERAVPGELWGLVGLAVGVYFKSREG